MTPLLFNLASDPALVTQLAQLLPAEPGELELHQFPDGESYLRIHSDCQGRDCLLFCNLFHPDEKLLPLLFAATTLRELGARRLLLISPYLAYMRQDKRFRPGECISSRIFAQQLSGLFDGLITVDPHLHRYHSLDEIYSLKSIRVPAAPLIAHWIRQQITQPLLIGPDDESEQWVSEVAQLAGAPWQILHKERHGDYAVEVSLPDVERWQAHSPVLVDDIISSGRTMLETLNHLQQAGLPRATCIGVHGIFAGDAYQRLQASADVVSTDCIPHPSNAISLIPTLAEACRRWLHP